MDQISNHVLVCTGGGCIASGALEVSAAFTKELEDLGIERQTRVIETGCLGPCAVGPVVLVYPDGVFYQNVKIEDVHEIVEEHLLKGRVVTRLVSHAPGTDRSVAEMSDVEFFNRQVKIVLRNSGIIDPLKIEEYIARDGYQALAKVLTEMTPEQVVERGPAQRPARPRRRRLLHRAEVEVRRQDRVATRSTSSATPTKATPAPSWTARVLEGDPHSRHRRHDHRRLRHRRQGGLRLRAGRVSAGRRAAAATPSTRPRDTGLLGKDIMGTGFDFDLEIRMGAGAFVCGEETALMPPSRASAASRGRGRRSRP